MLRWGIIGAGVIAGVRMAPAIRQATGSLHAPSADGTTDVPLKPVNMYVAEAEHFARCIAEGREPAISDDGS